MRNADDIGTFDVVIGGASFAGLSLAIALHAALPFPVRLAILDRAPLDTAARRPDARAYALSASSKRMLTTLGLWTTVEAVAEPVRTIEITDSSLAAGVRPVLLTYDNALDDGEPASYIVPSEALAAALTARAATLPGLSLLVPAEAAGFEAREPHVGIHLGDGRTLAAALLVAADGRRSHLRAAGGLDTVGWSYPQTGMVTRIAHERSHGGRAVQHFLPNGPFAILPLKGNRSCVTWTEDAAEAKRILSLDDPSFLAEVEQRAGGRLGAISLEGPRQAWPLDMHVARRTVARRFVLIGDAAQGVHPIAGQGLNLAFRDVAALTEVLADAARLGLDLGDGMALEHYERWRRFDSVLAAATFDGLNRLFSNDWQFLRSAREAGLSIVDRLPGVKEWLVREAAGLTGDLPRLLKGEPA